MNKLPIFILPALLLPAFLLATDYQQAQTRTASQSPTAAADKTFYETRADHDPDGIGKFYMGREIAHVMGYQGAEWLERPERIEEERPDQVVEQMKLKPADVVADVGAGTGYFSFRIAPRVPQGKVFAVDLQPQMLAIIEKRRKQLKADNVFSVKSTEANVELPENSIDVALMVDVYHEFSFPREMMLSLVKALKPGGRVVQIEYRGEDPDVPIKRLHKMTVAQCRKEMAAVGLIWKETKDFLPQQHFIVFEKSARQ
ncbi:MAG: class I SAM-dependent methyltransferase [Blastocatellales bacterium]